ncbi:hypothetical protein [uncultured Shewanella sp.]|uniref:hypothetical protein n=1 Tax=uncultured Shewanella sp. TaxID=173975 RepID=UPI00261E8399|nr:hypothetical protein [uncultured Shewanella sp.]
MMASKTYESLSKTSLNKENNHEIKNEHSLEQHCNEVNIKGYSLIKGLYHPDDIKGIAQNFDMLFMDKLKHGNVQCRDYRRYACKLPISKDYEAILNNSYIDKLMTRILGEGYVLFNFNSHSSLPGSSCQHMHVDSTDHLNSKTYVNGQTNVAFLHIPMINTDATHGATSLWPATLFTHRLLDTTENKWVRDNLSQSTNQLSLGDVIIKRDNCFHAGGKNKSLSRRHMITLIFVRKNVYLNDNSGVIPCGIYDKSNMPELPYRIASQCITPPQDLTATYHNKLQTKPIYSTVNTTQSISFKQLEYIEKGLSSTLFCKIKKDPKSFICNPNSVFNLIDYIRPLVKSSFGDSNFHFHSIKLNTNSKEFDCDDPVFKKNSRQTVFNNDNNLIKIHIPLESCNNWIDAYSGSKLLSAGVLENRNLFDLDKETLSSNKQDLLVTTGALVYSKLSDIPTIEITFVRFYFIPSYDDRFWVTDTFALTLPNRLGRLLRYDSIFITQKKYLDFKYSIWSHITYVTIDQILDIRMNNKIIGNLLLAVAATFIIPPFFIKWLLGNHVKRVIEIF